MTTPRNSAQAELWPALPYEDWKDTCTTLHLWTQIVGKVRLARRRGPTIRGTSPFTSRLVA